MRMIYGVPFYTNTEIVDMMKTCPPGKYLVIPGNRRDRAVYDFNERNNVPLMPFTPGTDWLNLTAYHLLKGK